MDLRDFTPKSSTVTVELKVKGKVLTNEDGSPMTVILHAPHTVEYKEVQYFVAEEALEKVAKDPDYKTHPKELMERSYKILAGLTKSWNITLDGKKPKLTQSNAEKVYKEVPLIKPQLEKALATFEDFT